MLKRIALTLALTLVLFFGYMAYMTSQHPFYLDFAADAAVSNGMVEHPFLKYGNPAKPVLINQQGYPCIPYPQIHNDESSYSHWVMALQDNLNSYHGFKLKVDGHYGDSTVRAVNQIKIRYNLLSKNGKKVDWTTWYVVVTQKSKEGNRFRLSGPNNTYWKAHNLTYHKYLSRTYVAKPAAKTAYFPVTGKCSMYSNWHAPRFPNRLHMGIDITAPNGRALVAIYPGRIQYSSSILGGTALWIITSNGKGAWYYCHLQKYAVKNGTVVKAGQVIAYCDSSGNAIATGSHLHIGWQYPKKGNAWKNPYPTLSALSNK